MIGLYSGLNPKLPDFMLPKKKKASASAAKASDVPQDAAEEPVAGTSTGGQTVQVICTSVLLSQSQWLSE